MASKTYIVTIVKRSLVSAETAREAKEAVESMYSIEYPYVPDRRIKYEKTIKIDAEVV